MENWKEARKSERQGSTEDRKFKRLKVRKMEKLRKLKLKGSILKV